MSRRGRRNRKRGRVVPKETAAAPPSGSADTLRNAVQLHEAGKLKEAADLYRTVLEAEPDNADALHLGGLLAHQRGDSATGIQAIRRAIEVAGDHPALFANLGNVLLESGDAAGATTAFERSLELDPEQPTSEERLATALKRLEKADDAIEHYRRAVQLASENDAPALTQARLQTNLGIALLDHGEVEAAIVALRMAVDTAPEFAVAYNNLGVALRRQGDLAAAAAVLTRAEGLSRAAAWSVADRARLYVNLGEIFLEQRDLERAAQSFDTAIELAPHDAAAIAGLGTVAKQRGDPEAAFTQFNRVVELCPSSGAAHNNLGSALCDLKRFDRALAAYERAIELDPDCLDAYANLTRLYRRLSRFEDAQRIYAAWLARDPDNPIASHMVAAARGETPARAPDDYVQQTFDTFATSFVDVLGGLDYRAPDLLADAVRAAGAEPTGDLHVLDAGCGTGLCGPWLAPYARELIGVDLSPRMLERADALGIYHLLAAEELTAFLSERPESFELIVAADVLVYFGALDEILSATASALRPGGLFAFTVESMTEEGFRLCETGRYAHSESYLRERLAAAPLELCSLAPEVLRREHGTPVQGWVVVAQPQPE